jgi:uncharacterized protein GlcG (DUF336 family)
MSGNVSVAVCDAGGDLKAFLPRDGVDDVACATAGAAAFA